MKEEKRGNLVLTRRADEAVVLKVSLPQGIKELLEHISPPLLKPEDFETEIEVTVVEFLPQKYYPPQVRLAFDAPKSNVKILREELLP